MGNQLSVLQEGIVQYGTWHLYYRAGWITEEHIATNPFLRAPSWETIPLTAFAPVDPGDPEALFFYFQGPERTLLDARDFRYIWQRRMAMKAIVIHENGGPEVLRYEDVTLPEPGQGEARVEVEYAAVNFMTSISARVFTKPFPRTLGGEGRDGSSRSVQA